MNQYKSFFTQKHHDIAKKVNFFKLKKFRPSEFRSISSDLDAVKNMGKIVDNSLMEAPLVLFNSERFAALEYLQKGSEFAELPLLDD